MNRLPIREIVVYILIALAVALLFLSQVEASPPPRTQLPATGQATYYGDGIMQTVLRNRLRWGHIQPGQCPACIGYVAMLWPADIGRAVCVEVNGQTYGPYLSIDVASSRDRPALIADGWILDVQYQVWFRQWRLPRNPTPVTVSDCSPQEETDE